jgi:hypothetical protein
MKQVLTLANLVTPACGARFPPLPDLFLPPSADAVAST